MRSGTIPRAPGSRAGVPSTIPRMPACGPIRRSERSVRIAEAVQVVFRGAAVVRLGLARLLVRFRGEQVSALLPWADDRNVGRSIMDGVIGAESRPCCRGGARPHATPGRAWWAVRRPRLGAQPHAAGRSRAALDHLRAGVAVTSTTSGYEGFAGRLDEFITAVGETSGGPLMEDGLQAQLITEAAVESMRDVPPVTIIYD